MCYLALFGINKLRIEIIFDKTSEKDYFYNEKNGGAYAKI
jgi:hypothetical protein